MNRNERITILLTALGLILAACACIATWLVVPQIQQMFSTPTSITPTASYTPLAISSLTSTSENSGMPTQENSPTPTNTLLPTSTPLPLPTTQPTVSIDLPFQDTFDLRLGQEWQQVLGTWRVVNGHLTTDENDDWRRIFVGDSAWQNYAVEVDAYSEDWFYPVQIIVRAQQGTYVAFETDFNNTDFILYGGGDPAVIAHSDAGVSSQSGRRNEWTYRLRVEAVDDIFSAYIDGNLVLQVQDSTLSTGRTGLAFDTAYSTWFDNFQVNGIP